MQASIHPVFEYQLDANDVLVSVSDDWLAFARENGASELVAESVVGKSLWDFIPDEPTRTLYRDVFATVRATDQPVVVPFRCDSPTLQRFMRLEVRHHPGCGIDLRSILVRAEPCERQLLLDRTARQSHNCVTMCSCCKQVLVEPHGWLSLEEANRHPRLCLVGKRPHIRYEVCTACRVVAAWQRFANINTKLEATRSSVTTENVIKWIHLAKEREALAKMIENSQEN